MVELRLKEGRERSLMRRHPWVFSRAIEWAGITPPPDGEEIRLVGHDGAFLGRGIWFDSRDIVCRVFRWEDKTVDGGFLGARIETAAACRHAIQSTGTDSYRLVNAEGDELPGIVIDKYADTFVVQLSGEGLVRYRDAIVDALHRIVPGAVIFRRLAGKQVENKERRIESWSGDLPGGPIAIRENGRQFLVDIAEGQKTGFFLDQRENRELLAGMVDGKRVLDAFCYTGGFTVAALAGGAENVVAVDASGPALEFAKRNIEENELDGSRAEFVRAKVFDYLRTDGPVFDVAVVDPPALARHRRDAEKGARAYKDVNLRAMGRLVPGGMLFTFSCSQHLSPERFQKVLFSAAKDAAVSAVVVGERSHAVDHPFSIYHPEGRYLHAFLMRIGS